MPDRRQPSGTRARYAERLRAGPRSPRWRHRLGRACARTRRVPPERSSPARTTVRAKPAASRPATTNRSAAPRSRARATRVLTFPVAHESVVGARCSRVCRRPLVARGGSPNLTTQSRIAAMIRSELQVPRGDQLTSVLVALPGPVGGLLIGSVVAVASPSLAPPANLRYHAVDAGRGSRGFDP